MINLVGNNGQLFGWEASTWLWLDQFGVLLGNSLMSASIVIAVAGWLQRERIHRWLRRNCFPAVGGEAGDDTRWDAILFTVSREEVPAWVMEQKRPAAVGLLSSDRSRTVADRLAQSARDQGITVTGPYAVEDPDDPARAMAETRHIIQRLRDDGHARIAVDVTGGKTPMSIGAFMAAEEEGCDTIYVSTDYHGELKRVDRRTARIRRISEARR